MTTAKERAEHMKLWARLSLARCPKCKEDKNAVCGCEASTRLKEINSNWKGTKNVVKAKVGGVCFKDGVITVEKYQLAKKQKVSDTTIQNQLGWHGMKMNRWKRDNGLLGKSVYQAEPKALELVTVTTEKPIQENPHNLKVVKTLHEKIEKLQKQHKDELETAEHYVKQTQKLNEALQGQVDKLAAELKEAKESMSGNWRELEQQVKADKAEYEKLAKDYEELDEIHERQKRGIVSLMQENDRVNELNTLLMENTLKIVERVGDIA